MLLRIAAAFALQEDYQPGDSTKESVINQLVVKTVILERVQLYRVLLFLIL
jgi:hypothetical protein